MKKKQHLSRIKIIEKILINKQIILISNVLQNMLSMKLIIRNVTINFNKKYYNNYNKI